MARIFGNGARIRRNNQQARVDALLADKTSLQSQLAAIESSESKAKALCVDLNMRLSLAEESIVSHKSRSEETELQMKELQSNLTLKSEEAEKTEQRCVFLQQENVLLSDKLTELKNSNALMLEIFEEQVKASEPDQVKVSNLRKRLAEKGMDLGGTKQMLAKRLKESEPES